VLRPVAAVVAVTLLVALDLGVNNFAARNLGLVPLIWVSTLGPGLVAGILLFVPRRMVAARPGTAGLERA
jgi:lipopolysaccharide export system permease protein